LESIGKLAGGVAHDFNNLLTAIMGYCDLLLGDIEPDSRNHNDIKEIQKAADRASSLTRQLLAFSRRQVLKMEIVDINLLLKNMKHILERLAGEPIELHFNLSSKPQRVKVDLVQMEQIIINLVLNARDATPYKGQITITTKTIDNKNVKSNEVIDPSVNHFVMISVRDTGVGILPEMIDRIFDPFFTTKEPGQGTGLGLSSVYGIVKQSQGYVNVESKIDEGTEFCIYLPLMDNDILEQNQDESPAPSLHGSERILLVEDDQVIRELVPRVLKHYGYQVLSATDGLEALELYMQQNQNFDLLITDVILPKMSGRDLANQLCSLQQTLQVLFISGHTEKDIVKYGMLQDDIHFLQKPFTSEELTKKVRSIFESD
jgi:CheY-like chemotaxis protein